MPLVVLQGLGLVDIIRRNIRLSQARKRIVEPNDAQVIHFDFENVEVA